MTFTFGIYPGGALGGGEEMFEPVRPDNPQSIRHVLDDLHGDTPGFLVRAYLPYRPPPGSGERPTPAQPELLLGNGRKLELVLGYRDPDGDVDGYLAFVRDAVSTYGDRIALLQICEEPNADLPFLDGRTPDVRRALVHGVVTAAEHAAALGLDLAVGFNAVPALGSDLSFWQDLAAIAAAEAPGFHQALGYVGLDFFPDVFHPIPLEDLAARVRALLTDFRERILPAAGIGPDLPFRITENGWPTGPGPDRGEERQAEVLRAILDTVTGLSAQLAISGYSHFGLRDADTAGSTLFHHFGLLHDDYTPKPAFAVYRDACRRGRV
ncbi:MAG: hypothetical protein HOV83_33870 [Catenulispora sp.]|nr:hypothetical protein [Catenulispora sp.]